MPAGFYRFHAVCAEAAQCPVEYQAGAHLGKEQWIEIRQFGIHDHQGQEHGYGSIFNFREEEVASRCVERGTDDFGITIRSWQTAEKS